VAKLTNVFFLGDPFMSFFYQDLFLAYCSNEKNYFCEIRNLAKSLKSQFAWRKQRIEVSKMAKYSDFVLNV